jgi:hypothetical protein
MSRHDEEFMAGYFDGRGRTAPEPSDNRSACYRHSFVVGRAEINGCPILASLSREHAAEAEVLDSSHD